MSFYNIDTYLSRDNDPGGEGGGEGIHFMDLSTNHRKTLGEVLHVYL